MTPIPILTGTVSVNGVDRVTNTKELIQGCLNQVPEKGFTYQDIKNRMRIDEKINALKPEDQVLQLEDADFLILKQYVKTMTWTTRSKFIAEFHEQFL
jgi:hypothetical protein